MPEVLRQRVAAYIHRHDLLRAGDRVAVAVSGGADSVALLRILIELRGELGVVLSVVHFNHQIRGADADADQHFVAALAKEHRLEFNLSRGDTPAFAAHANLSLETAARELRYGFFGELLAEHVADKIATAHTLDDQAETVLMRFVRGSWTKGLAGIYPKLASADGTIVRPLLGIRRPELEDYLRCLKQQWREDASNQDLKHARNRVRHVLLPLLEREFNPAIRQVLAENAEIARAEEEWWGQGIEASDLDNIFRPTLFRDVPLALQRRLVRTAAAKYGITLDFQQVEEVIGLADAHAGTEIELPDNWVAVREHDLIALRQAAKVVDYEYPLPVPGEVRVTEIGMVLRVSVVPVGPDEHRHDLLDLRLLPPDLRVRNWRPGDRYWPAHTKEPRKVKELLQPKHASGPGRALWPVVAGGGELVWMRGFPVPQHFAPAADATEAAFIEERAL